MRGYDFFLVLLAGLGLVSLGAGDLTIGLMFTLIGIPLAVLILALPSIALVLCSARILDRALLRHLVPGIGPTGYIAVGLVLVALAGLSLTANQMQGSQIVALQRGDHNDLRLPLTGETIAYVSGTPSVLCGDFCQRLLLAGQAKQVLVTIGSSALAEGPLDPATPAQSWRIEDRPTCPPVDLPRDGTIRIAGAPTGNDALRADLVMRAGIAAGHCLIGGLTTLAGADVVITDVTMRTSVSPNHAGFSLGDDLISASRRAVWVRTDAGLTEQARWTHVSATKMFPLALPVVHASMNSGSDAGFARSWATGLAPDPGFGHLVSQTLGLRLSLDDIPLATGPTGEDPLLANLQKSGTLDANTLLLAANRIEAMGQTATQTDADRTLFLQVFGDPRVPVQHGYATAVAVLLRDAPPDFAPAVAGLGFARLDGLLLPDLNLGALSFAEQAKVLKRVNPTKATIGHVGDVLAQLPPSAVKPYGPAIFALARDRENRTEPYRLLIHLGTFGDSGARALIGLLADADNLDPKRHFTNNQWQHAYLAAMIGLCRMGREAAPVLPDLLKLADSGELKLSGGPLGRLTVITLIRLGQPAATLPALAMHEEYPISGRELERAMAEGQGDRSCGF